MLGAFPSDHGAYITLDHEQSTTKLYNAPPIVLSSCVTLRVELLHSLLHSLVGVHLKLLHVFLDDGIEGLLCDPPLLHLRQSRVHVCDKLGVKGDGDAGSVYSVQR